MSLHFWDPKNGYFPIFRIKSHFLPKYSMLPNWADGRIIQYKWKLLLLFVIKFFYKIAWLWIETVFSIIYLIGKLKNIVDSYNLCRWNLMFLIWKCRRTNERRFFRRSFIYLIFLKAIINGNQSSTTYKYKYMLLTGFHYL